MPLFAIMHKIILYIHIPIKPAVLSKTSYSVPDMLISTSFSPDLSSEAKREVKTRSHNRCVIDCSQGLEKASTSLAITCSQGSHI
jgi:hypothetical protein